MGRCRRQNHPAVWQIYLPVCEDGGVVTLEAAVDQLLRAGGVDGVLLRVHVEHVVVREGLVFSQDDLGLSGHHVGADVASLYLLSGQLRTNPEGKQRFPTSVVTTTWLPKAP